MATIAVIIDDMFEDSEYQKPVDEFQKAGHDIEHVGLKKGAVVRGKKEGTEVKIDRPVSDAEVDDFFFRH